MTFSMTSTTSNSIPLSAYHSDLCGIVLFTSHYKVDYKSRMRNLDCLNRTAVIVTAMSGGQYHSAENIKPLSRGWHP